MLLTICYSPVSLAISESKSKSDNSLDLMEKTVAPIRLKCCVLVSVMFFEPELGNYIWASVCRITVNDMDGICSRFGIAGILGVKMFFRMPTGHTFKVTIKDSRSNGFGEYSVNKKTTSNYFDFWDITIPKGY